MSTKKKSTMRPTMAKALASLAKLNKPALQKKYRAVFGKPTMSDNVVNLRAAIARKIAGEPKAPAKKPSAPTTTTPTTTSRERDPRLPAVGSVLERTYNDVLHKVKVLDDGFEYRGERHRSLSAIAKLITGQVWNGFLFFGVVTRPRTKSPSAEARA